MAVIRRKVFVGPTFYFGLRSMNYYRDRLRDVAEAFVNDVIGIERVVSISEHVTGNGPFSVSVWFRDDDDISPASTSEKLSYRQLRAQPKGFDVMPPVGPADDTGEVSRSRP